MSDKVLVRVTIEIEGITSTITDTREPTADIVCQAVRRALLGVGFRESTVMKMLGEDDE